MTWAALFLRLWRALLLRFRNFHECPECGVPMERYEYLSGPDCSAGTGWRCEEVTNAHPRAK